MFLLGDCRSYTESIYLILDKQALPHRILRCFAVKNDIKTIITSARYSPPVFYNQPKSERI